MIRSQYKFDPIISSTFETELQCETNDSTRRTFGCTVMWLPMDRETIIAAYIQRFTSLRQPVVAKTLDAHTLLSYQPLSHQFGISVRSCLLPTEERRTVVGR